MFERKISKNIAALQILKFIGYKIPGNFFIQKVI